jgi:hypothetical protein
MEQPQVKIEGRLEHDLNLQNGGKNDRRVAKIIDMTNPTKMMWSSAS